MTYSHSRRRNAVQAEIDLIRAGYTVVRGVRSGLDILTVQEEHVLVITAGTVDNDFVVDLLISADFMDKAGV